MSWSRAFDAPIPGPDGGLIRTLEDAAIYVTALPKRIYLEPHWQLAMEQLIEAAEDRGPVLHARIGMLRALNHGKAAPKAKPRGRKKARAYRIIGADRS